LGIGKDMTSSGSNQRSKADTVATVILFVLAAIAGAVSLSFSFFS
jgi:hypothetical protein